MRVELEDRLVEAVEGLIDVLKQIAENTRPRTPEEDLAFDQAKMDALLDDDEVDPA